LEKEYIFAFVQEKPNSKVVVVAAEMRNGYNFFFKLAM
jgi:hypothetical protein